MGPLFALLALLLFALVPLARMLLGNGPNSFRKLLRLDIAAFFVITSGFAAAFAVARIEQGAGWICIMVIVLPIALVLSWLLRYMMEDIAIGFAKRRDRQNAAADLAFLKPGLAKLEDTPLVAELVGESSPQATPPQDGTAAPNSGECRPRSGDGTAR